MDTLNYSFTAGEFNFEILAEPETAYFLEQSIDLENWESFSADWSELPLINRTKEVDTATDTAGFFRLTSKPLNQTPPIITELSLYLGALHAQTDGRHRIRFHIETEFWNPYNFSIKLQGASQNIAYYMVFENLPTLTVTNVTKGLSFSVDLGNIPLEIAGSESRRKVSSWIEIEDLELRSGEIYHSIEPDPSFHARGLARYIASRENRWSASTATNISPSDEVRIEVTACNISVYLVPYVGGYDSSTDQFVLSSSVVSLLDIPYEGFILNLLGQAYSRPTSSDYILSDFNFGYHLKLRDPHSIDTLLPLINPNTAIIDFNDPSILNLFEITSDPAALPSSLFYLFSPVDTFSDESRNSHTPKTDRPDIFIFSED